jgi:hypothetical protein
MPGNIAKYLYYWGQNENLNDGGGEDQRKTGRE